MDRKKLAAVAMICGGVAFIAVLMPWYSSSVSGVTGVGGSWINGTQADFNGVFVLLLAVAGGAAAALVAFGKTGVLPLDEPQHLFAALGLFALAVIVTLTDVFRDLPSMSNDVIQMGKSFGLYLTLIATVAGAAASFLAVRKPSSGSSASTGE